MKCECGSYGLKEKCDCGSERKRPKPPKYSPEDRYANYRRAYKKEKGLL
ncbi:nucleolar RNA-binding Nop10p family protein [Nanoarchaeota archaeon]